MPTLEERIVNKEVIIIDGATGTELERRGVPMDNNAWCGIANETHPDSVRELHADYIRAGADVIIANTFGTAPHVIAATDYDAHALNRKAVALAREARDTAADRQVWVAGSMSPMPPLTDIVLPTDEQARASYAELAETLAEAGADLIICEMMTHSENATLVVEAASKVGLPIWIGFSAETNTAQEILPWGAQQFGLDGDFQDTLDTIIPMGASVMGIMHTAVADTDRVLDMLKKQWAGPLLAYAESGVWEPPNWHHKGIISTDDYVTATRRWVDNDVQIIGGCCGIGPEHIRALKDALPETLN